MEFNYRVYAEPSPLVIVLSVALSLVQLVALWKIFVKAGEPGWAAIVPIYNLYITFKIAWGMRIASLIAHHLHQSCLCDRAFISPHMGRDEMAAVLRRHFICRLVSVDLARIIVYPVLYSL